MSPDEIHRLDVLARQLAEALMTAVLCTREIGEAARAAMSKDLGAPPQNPRAYQIAAKYRAAGVPTHVNGAAETDPNHDRAPSHRRYAIPPIFIGSWWRSRAAGHVRKWRLGTAILHGCCYNCSEVHMSRMEDLVDQVIGAFEARRRRHWSAIRLSVTGEDQKLKRWHQLVEERLTAFRLSTVDRAPLIERVQTRFKGKEWTADFAAVADELQRMARHDLERYMVDNGVPEESAAEIAEGYSIGALLNESANQ